MFGFADANGFEGFVCVRSQVAQGVEFGEYPGPDDGALADGEGRLIGKPEDEVRAHEYLAQLSGLTHRVLSGLAVLGPTEDQARTGVVESRVTFMELDNAEIARYLASGEWRGRAGGYAIQGRGSSLVASVEGDIANVIGLPVGLLLELAPELNPPA